VERAPLVRMARDLPQAELVVWEGIGHATATGTARTFSCPANGVYFENDDGRESSFSGSKTVAVVEGIVEKTNRKPLNPGPFLPLRSNH